MFDPIFYGVTPESFNEANQAHATNTLTIMLALINKGLLDEGELCKARIQATHAVEQSFAKKAEEQTQAFDKEHPGIRQLLSDIFGAD